MTARHGSAAGYSLVELLVVLVVATTVVTVTLPLTAATTDAEKARHAASFVATRFRLARQHRQFVLPIALHKALGSRGTSERIERVLAAAGLLRLAGSRVTVLAER